MLSLMGVLLRLVERNQIMAFKFVVYAELAELAIPAMDV
jgi:hypothetical protein